MKKELVWLIVLTVVVLSGFGGMGFYIQDMADSKKGLSKEEVKKVIDENPLYFAESFKGVMIALQQKEGEKRREAELKKMEALFENPLKPDLKGQIYLGPEDAPITIVEYSDFECSYCSRAAETVKTLLKTYPGKIKFIYKHLPLKFHKSAMVAAQYFEAAILQDKKKGFDFHFKIFEEQRKLGKGGEKFLLKLAKQFGFDMTQLKKDANSGKVLLKIKGHVDEATKYEINGTPGFLVNGVPIKGAYPIEYFHHVIKKLQEKGNFNL